MLAFLKKGERFLTKEDENKRKNVTKYKIMVSKIENEFKKMKTNNNNRRT